MTLNNEVTLGENMAFQVLILNDETAWIGCGNNLSCQAVVRPDFGTYDR